jgi:hypothetical protein
MHLSRLSALALALGALATPAAAQMVDGQAPAERQLRTRGVQIGVGLAGSSYRPDTGDDTRFGGGGVARLAYGLTPRLKPYLEGEAIVLRAGGNILSHVDAGLRIYFDLIGVLPAPYFDLSLAATEVWDDPGGGSGMNSVSFGGGLLLPYIGPVMPDLGAKLTFGSYAWLDSVRIRTGASWSPRGRR